MHWQTVALHKDEQFEFGSLGFNLCRESLMCRHPSYRPGLTVRTALPSCVVSGWTLAMDGGCLAHATCYLLFLLFLHPSCGSLKAQTNCVLRPIVITLEPTKHLNRRTKYSSQFARTPEVQSWFLSPLLGEEGEPRL